MKYSGCLGALSNKTKFFSYLVVALLSSVLFFSQAKQSHASVQNWQKGVNIYPTSNTDFNSDNFKQSLRNLSDTGANYVNLVIPYYQSNVYSTDLNRGNNTPTDESLINAINYAHSLNMKVMLKVFAETYDGQWRAYINPSDRDGWFHNYGSILNHYASLSQTHGVEGMTLGTELIHMSSARLNPSNTQHWNSMIQDVRNNFSGYVTYSAQWKEPIDEKNEIEFWPALDSVGISAYFSLSNEQNPSIETLKASWDKWNNSDIRPLHEKYNKPILLTEVGYKSNDWTFVSPGDWTRSAAFNETTQANGYEALLSYFDQYDYIQGVHFWDWKSNPYEGGQWNTDYTPQHKQAQGVMKKWFTGGKVEAASIVVQPAVALTPKPVDPVVIIPKVEPVKEVLPVPSKAVVPKTAALDIWWPSNENSVQGVQPFKALAKDMNVSDYTMYWQVDGGQLNMMDDNYTDYPHKEALVDLNPWNWNTENKYSVNFVVKNKQGVVIGEKSIVIMVTH